MLYMCYFVLIIFPIFGNIYAENCDPGLNRILYNGKCETLLEQGPCKYGEWLVYDEIYKTAKCAVNKCPPIKEPVYKYFCGDSEINLQDNSCAPDKFIYKDINGYNYIERAFWNGECINYTVHPCKINMELKLLPTGEPVCGCYDFDKHIHVQLPGKEGGCYEPYYRRPCNENEFLVPIFENGIVVGTECRKNNCQHGEIKVIKENVTGHIILHDSGKCIKLGIHDGDDDEFCIGDNFGLTVTNEFTLECAFLLVGVVPLAPQNNINRISVGCIYGAKNNGICKNSSLFLAIGSG